MKTQRLITAFLLSGLLAAPALAFEVKPGEWEMKIDAGGGHVLSQKICITPEQAKTHFSLEGMAAGNAGSKICKTTSSQSGGVLAYQVKCSGPAKMESKGTAKMIGENEMEVEQTITMGNQTPPVQMKGTSKRISDTEIDSTMTTTGGFAKGTIQATNTQKYIGPTCGKDAMPLPGANQPAAQ